MLESLINQKRIKKILMIAIFTCLFGTLYLIHTRVRAYGDDWFYYTFSRVDFSYYVKRNIEHYFLANGRVIVHLLVTLFLKLPPTAWRIVNTLFLISIAYIIMSISTNYKRVNIDKRIFSILIITFFLSTLEGYMTSQSIYWLTGSFNYVYPLFMVLLLIYFYLKEQTKPRGFIYLLGFLAGATVEQAGMMAFGFLLLNLLYKGFILKRKVSRHEIMLIFFTLIGLLTVLFAPATFLRISIEDRHSESLLELIKYNINIQGTTFLFSRMMIPTHILTVFASLIAINYRLKQSIKIKIFEIIVISFGLTSIMGLFYQFLSKTAYIQYHIFVWKQALFFGFIGLGYGMLLGYAAYIIFIYSNIKLKALPIILLVIGFGSMIMLLISPVFGFRNLIFVMFILILYSLFIMQINMKYEWLLLVLGIYYYICFRPSYAMILIGLFFIVSLGARHSIVTEKTIFLKELLIISLVGLLVAINFIPIYHGFSANAHIYDANLAKATHYTNDSKKTLEQTKMANYNYRWVMPYENVYYKPYYNLYIGTDMNQEILWIK